MNSHIPSDWSTPNLGDIVEYLGSGISRPFYSDSVGRPVLRSNNVKSGEIVLDELKYWHDIDPRGADLRTVTPRHGDILINFVNGSASELGKSAVYRGQPENCIVSTNFFIVRLNNTVALPDYVVIYLQSDFYRHWLSEVVGFTGQGSFNQKELRRLSIPLPQVREQEAIATIFHTWDRGIRQLSDLISAKLCFKQGLMQHLLRGQRRFPGFTEDWKHVRIGGVACEISERNPVGDSIPVLSCTKYDGLVDSLEYFGRRVFSENTDNYKVVRRNDFAYATNHIEEGSIGLLKHADAGLVSPMYTVFRTNGDVNPDYLYRVLKTETLRQVFASFTSASVNRRGSLRWKLFSTIPLDLPSIDEQSHINKAMAAFDLEVELLQKQLYALKQQKKGLMQKLLTGQLRTRGIQ